MHSPVDSRRAGVILALFLFLVTATTGFLWPFVPLYLEASGLRKGQVGLVLGAATGFALVIQPVLGRLTDRLDARRPVIVGTALAAIGTYLAFPYVQGFVPFLLLNAVGSNCTLYMGTAGAVLVSRLVSAERGGSTYATYRMWGTIGFIFVALLSGVLVGTRGPIGGSRQELDPLFRTGPWLFLLIAAVALLLPDRRNREDAAVGEVPMNPRLRPFLVAYLLYVAALYGAVPFLGIFLKSLGASGLWVTVAFAVGATAELLVMRKAGALSDRYGRRPLLAIAFAALPLRMLLYIPAMSPLWVAGVQTFHGLNFGIVGTVAIAYANDFAAEGAQGRTQARLAATAGLATAVAPLLFGAISDAYGLRVMFGVSALIALGAFLVLLMRVEESHPAAIPLAERGPGQLGWLLRLLDAPPTVYASSAPSEAEKSSPS